MEENGGERREDNTTSEEVHRNPGNPLRVSVTRQWNSATSPSIPATKFDCQRADCAAGNREERLKKESETGGRPRVPRRRQRCHKKSPAAHKVTLDAIWRMPNGSRPLRRFRAYFFGVVLRIYICRMPGVALSDSMLIKSWTRGNEAS